MKTASPLAARLRQQMQADSEIIQSLTKEQLARFSPSLSGRTKNPQEVAGLSESCLPPEEMAENSHSVRW
ncbi:hypothetical protein [Staphylococcus xylosus]|uniref:hypothetical protein n=1 Tax=Staphylococcus xylosus TaxID=1288 RepID=UPI002109FED3|nr:hypothetical protein [Staphylococcus xylosus]